MKPRDLIYQRWPFNQLHTVPPWYMGVAWRDYARQQLIFVVVPFNLLAGVGRWIWWRVRNGVENSPCEKMQEEIERLRDINFYLTHGILPPTKQSVR